MATLKELIESCPVSTVTKPAEQWELPEVDYHRFKEEERKMSRTLVGALGRFLDLPYLFSMFENHFERDEWYEKVAAEHGSEAVNMLKGSTCVKKNAMDRAAAAVQGLAIAYQGPYQEAARAIAADAYDMASRTYLLDTNPVKAFKLVGMFKKKVYEALQIMARE